MWGTDILTQILNWNPNISAITLIVVFRQNCLCKLLGLVQFDEIHDIAPCACRNATVFNNHYFNAIFIWLQDVNGHKMQTMVYHSAEQR